MFSIVNWNQNINHFVTMHAKVNVFNLNFLITFSYITDKKFHVYSTIFILLKVLTRNVSNNLLYKYET